VSALESWMSSASVRGFLGRCPSCGKGRLFRRFLKVNDSCPACGEELHHHRADDFPAYLVIVIVGHLIVPAALHVEMHFSPSYWVHLALGLPLTVGLSLGLLQPIKGAVIAAQWRLGMHGFAESRKASATVCAHRDSARLPLPVTSSPLTARP
jgi:uncharacterized protein (DUF983 family)